MRIYRWRRWQFTVSGSRLIVRRTPKPGCGACGGRGWFFTIGTTDPVEPPERCSGAAICGCADRHLRIPRALGRRLDGSHQPPF